MTVPTWSLPEITDFSFTPGHSPKLLVVAGARVGGSEVLHPSIDVDVDTPILIKI